ncbi:MAG TPA: hypothetical protein VIY53_19720 [Acidobacteriaceae bacterium]
MPFYRLVPLLLVTVLPPALMAQGTPMIPAAPAAGAPTAPSTVSATVRPALSQVAQTLDGINVKRWKAPNPVRDSIDGDVSSIQRDLSGTLAGLLQQADAAPTSVPAAFSVYRNVDALYDTLLRVVETAELAAPENEEAQLETALKTLENARSSLGDAILSGSEREQAEVIQLRTAAAAVVEHHREQVKTTVVDDGPAPAHTVHHKHTTTTAKKPEPKTTQSTQNPSSPQ